MYEPASGSIEAEGDIVSADESEAGIEEQSHGREKKCHQNSLTLAACDDSHGCTPQFERCGYCGIIELKY